VFDFLTSKVRKAIGSFSETADVDPLTGVKTRVHYDAIDDKVHFETIHDVQPLLEMNKRQYNQFDERSRFGDSMVRGTVARLPLWLYFDLMRKGIATDEMALAKWLDDPENSGWRTRPGKLSR
jgi:hypothetical protein